MSVVVPGMGGIDLFVCGEQCGLELNYNDDCCWRHGCGGG